MKDAKCEDDFRVAFEDARGHRIRVVHFDVVAVGRHRQVLIALAHQRQVKNLIGEADQLFNAFERGQVVHDDVVVEADERDLLQLRVEQHLGDGESAFFWCLRDEAGGLLEQHLRVVHLPDLHGSFLAGAGNENLRLIAQFDAIRQLQVMGKNHRAFDAFVDGNRS